MFAKLLVLALAASPLVAAHGRVDVVTGDAGGNGTALAIQGGVVPLTGKNKVVSKEATVDFRPEGTPPQLTDTPANV
jgi:hypothetical protein